MADYKFIQTWWQAALDLKGDKPIRVELTNTLAFDASAGTMFDCVLNDAANKAMSITNIVDLVLYRAKIVNTNATTVTITLPTAAGNVRTSAQFLLPQNLKAEIEIMKVASKIYWSVSPLKTVTV